MGQITGFALIDSYEIGRLSNVHIKDASVSAIASVRAAKPPSLLRREAARFREAHLRRIVCARVSSFIGARRWELAVSFQKGMAPSYDFLLAGSPPEAPSAPPEGVSPSIGAARTS